MTDYSTVLAATCPDGEWTLRDNDYNTLVWLSDGTPPSQAELDGAWPQVQHDLAYAQVERQRKAAYERHADPVFFRWQRGTATEQDWLDAVQAVKDAHPYPEPV